MGMMYGDRVLMFFPGGVDACGYHEDTYPLREARPDGYLLDGVRLEAVLDGDGDGGRLYVPLRSVRATPLAGTAARPTREVVSRIAPGCVVSACSEEARGGRMKVTEVRRETGGTGKLDHLRITLR